MDLLKIHVLVGTLREIPVTHNCNLISSDTSLNKKLYMKYFFIFLIYLHFGCFYHFFKKLLDYHESWLIFLGKIFSTSFPFPILKVKFSVAEIVKSIFFKNIF